MCHLGNHLHKFNYIPFPDYATLTNNKKEDELPNSYFVTIFIGKENNILNGRPRTNRGQKGLKLGKILKRHLAALNEFQPPDLSESQGPREGA